MEQSFFKRILALLLCLVMAFSTVSTALATEVQPEDIIHYVSLGDSMTNGYCFSGYGQGRDYGMTSNKFSEGTNVYGDAAYPNLFAEWLASKTGMTVDHKKLAVSAMRAEDLYYILGGREMPTDGWFSQTEYYSNTNGEALKGIYQNAISNADIISMSIGNASFGAYLVQYFTGMLGIFGSVDEDELVDLEKAISILPEEKQTAIMEVYNKILTAAESYIPENIGGLIDTQKLIDMMAYISVGFLFNYEGVLDKIVELNPDVEIILIGLMNTTYGLRVVGEGMEPIPFGDIVGAIFDVLNAYIAGLPAVKQMKGEWPDAKFYYADTPDPEFIVQEFKTMAENDWVDDGEGLSEDVVRSRTIEAYNEMLCPMIGGALGFNLPVLKLEDVASYEFIGGDADPYTVPTQYAQQAGEYGQYMYTHGGNEPSIGTYPLVDRFLAVEGNSVADLSDQDKVAACFKGDIEKEISVAIYLALEDALVTSVDNMDITLDGLMGIATDIMGTLGDFPEALSQNPGPKTIHDELYKWFTEKPTSLGMCKVFAMFKAGNGMSVHPTPAAHEEIAHAMELAYANKTTAADIFSADVSRATMALYRLVKEHGPEILEKVEAFAVQQGWVTAEELAAVEEQINAVAVAYQAKDNGAMLEACGKLAKTLYSYAEEKGIISDEKLAEYGDALLDLLKKYGADALKAIVNVAVEKEWIGEDTLAALDKEFKAIDKAAKDKDIKKLLAGCAELAGTLYSYADTKDLIPAEVKSAIVAIKQAAATVEKVVEVERKVVRGVATVAVVGGVTYLGVSAVRHMVDKYQAAKEATAAKEAAAEAAVVQSAARINTVGGVQQWLNDNYDAGLTVDGGYGNMTKQAIVKALQKELGFTGADVDGVAGSKTLSALPELKNGSQGNTVVLLQCLLLGGGYGNDVEQAVLALQKAQGMPQTGVCDSQVWKALLG